jgi:hypothetical protein
MATRRGAKTTEEPKKEVAEVTEDLVAVIEELNTLLGLDPAIPTEGDIAKIEAALKTGAELVAAEDKADLSESTWKYLEENGLIEHLNAPAETKAPETKPEQKKRTPPTPPKRYTRLESIVDAIKTGETGLAALAKKADELFVKGGGKSNVEMAAADLAWAGKILDGLGLAELKKDSLTLKK